MALGDLSALRPAGWQARLELELGLSAGRTTVKRRRHSGPLVVQRPFHPESDGTCHVYLLHPPGGVAGGDELSVDVSVLPAGSALLTTPAATKLYRTSGAKATLRQSFTLHAGATLEWLPQETIVFGGARVESLTRVLLGPRARYVGWEIACLGRPAAGDAFETGFFRQRTELWREDKPLVIDHSSADASSNARAGVWGWGGRSVYATLIASYSSEELIHALRSAVQPAGPGELFAATALPEVTVCRWLGASGERARAALRQAWGVIREHVFHKAACAPRIWTT